jgi:hypothetical protein
MVPERGIYTNDTDSEMWQIVKKSILNHECRSQILHEVIHYVENPVALSTGDAPDHIYLSEELKGEDLK